MIAFRKLFIVSGSEASGGFVDPQMANSRSAVPPSTGSPKAREGGPKRKFKTTVEKARPVVGFVVWMKSV